MAVTTITLFDPQTGITVPLRPVDGITAMTLDVSASARASIEDLVGTSGGFDTTKYLTNGTVSLSLRLWPASDGVTMPEDQWDRLAPLLNPSLRPYLIVGNDQWDQPRQVTVRYDNNSKPLSDPTFWDVQIQWVAPKPVWEGLQVQAVIQAFIPSSTGFVFDVPGAVITSAGYVFPATSAPSPSQIVSEGTSPSDWVAQLYGPATAPKLANDITGQTIEFTGSLVLNPGDYVEIDSAAHTANLNSDPTASVLSALNFSSLGWWQIQPGLNIIRYYPDDASPGSEAVITYRPAWAL